MKLEDFCQSHLVSLLDIESVSYTLNPSCKSFIAKTSNVRFEVDRDYYCLVLTFDTTLWTELSFEVIPFLSLLDNNFNVIDMSVMYYRVGCDDTMAVTRQITVEGLENLDDKYYMRHFWINISRGTF